MGVLNGRIAVVTGSSRGIGAAIARLFAREGAAVVVHGRDADAIEAVRTAIAADGGTAIGVAADLARFDEIEAMRAEAERRLGPVDILVTNAGGNPVPPRPVETLDEADWRATVDANLTATFLCLKSFLPGMKERGRGAIVTMSSAAARRPTAYSPIAYAAAKAGIEVLTQGVAAQAGPAGVRINGIAPETILTERNRRQIPADVQERLIGEHPVRRLGTPEDVAQAALYLASDAAAWVTGIVVDVAGGSVLK
jgi:3-oxoacyl-[acyl-carrier protein] reductase